MTTIHSQEQWDAYTPTEGDTITFVFDGGTTTAKSSNPLKEVTPRFPYSELTLSGSAEGTAHGRTLLYLRDSSRGVAYDRVAVTARGTSAVCAHDDSVVSAHDASTVYATDRAHVLAKDQSSVSVLDDVRVSVENAATCILQGRARARVGGCGSATGYDDSTIHVSGINARAVVSDRATCVAFNTTVAAFKDAHVEAYDQAAVHLMDSATAVVGASSAVFIHDEATVSADGTSTVVISSPHSTIGATNLIKEKEDPSSAAEWAEFHGVTVKDGRAVLYKAVGEDFITGADYGTPVEWVIGQEVACKDWAPTRECGHGLHLSPTPGIALAYKSDVTHFLECEVDLDVMVPLPGVAAPKCKAPRVMVVREVDIRGRALKEEN